MCHNPSLELMTKARACKVVGQKGSPGANPHIPKGASTLGVGVSVDSWIFKEQLQGSKSNGLKSYLYHWKAIGM